MYMITEQYVMRSGVVTDNILIRFRFVWPWSSFALVQFTVLFYSLRGFLFIFYKLQITRSSAFFAGKLAP